MEEIASFIMAHVTTSGGVVPAFIDYMAVIVGSATGALFACDRKLDIIGTVVCGLLTGYGGGILRDFLLQDEGVYFMAHPYLFLLCVVICAFVFYFRGVFRHLDATVFLADTLSVALYAVAGASKAFACGSGFIMSIVCGAITAVGGGAIRDSFVGQTPSIFKSSNYYAVAALAGSFVYVLLAAFGADVEAAALMCVTTVVVLRYLSVLFNWKTGDDPLDLTPYVSRPVKRVTALVKGLFLRGSMRDGAQKPKRRLRWRNRNQGGGQ